MLSSSTASGPPSPLEKPNRGADGISNSLPLEGNYRKRCRVCRANIEVGEARMRCSHRSGVILFFHGRFAPYTSSEFAGSPTFPSRGRLYVTVVWYYKSVAFATLDPSRPAPLSFSNEAKRSEESRGGLLEDDT